MTAAKRIESVEGLRLLLNGQEVGILTHYSGGKNIVVFSPDYIALDKTSRNTLTMTQLANEAYLSKPLISAQRLPPVLSNLLPEGALRDWMALSLKVHVENEFPLIAHMGKNLPGALQVDPISSGNVPSWALNHREQVEAFQLDVEHDKGQFSLAGVQMKFSSLRQQDGGFFIGQETNSQKLLLTNNESWIIKTPSTVHNYVPYNEYTAMKLAGAVGIDIPDIKLVELTQLNNLPDIQLPNEVHAYAIKRFDRQAEQRIHTEDFAQVFQLYAHDKYKKVNYEQIADALYRYSSQGLKDVQQMARRLLVNILLANGDAHLKNWSLIYPDCKRPMLSPAYDIVSTIAYIKGEQEFALNMAKNKNWYQVNFAAFQAWAKRIGVPWQAIKVHIIETLELARSHWPLMLAELPMDGTQQKVLMAHWQNLHSDFRIA